MRTRTRRRRSGKKNIYKRKRLKVNKNRNRIMKRENIDKKNTNKLRSENLFVK